MIRIIKDCCHNLYVEHGGVFSHIQHAIAALFSIELDLLAAKIECTWPKWNIGITAWINRTRLRQASDQIPDPKSEVATRGGGKG